LDGGWVEGTFGLVLVFVHLVEDLHGWINVNAVP
jgi:hypothetical protein